MTAELSEPDRAALARADVKETVMKMTNGAFHQGARGATWEYVLLARPWGFPLEDIRMPVYLWHGEMDTMCPINMGRYVAKAIPNCRAKFFPEEGHVSLIVNHFEEILSALIS